LTGYLLLAIQHFVINETYLHQPYKLYGHVIYSFFDMTRE
jgi:hypothetical protein